MRTHPKPPATTAELTAYRVGYDLDADTRAWLVMLGPAAVGDWVFRGMEEKARGDGFRG